DRIDWIWEPYLPAGAVTLMAGAPGCGKSFLSTALAASLSQGLTPFYQRPTGKVRTAILSLEDDPARTIVPRLKACGADLGEIVIFDWRHREADSLETLSMKEGTRGELLRVLREGARLYGLGLVIIDTLTAFTPAGVDGHEAVAVRRMMKPLARFASDCGVGVLVICHARKRSSHDSTHGVQATVLGSVDYVASCRSALLVQRDPKAEEGTAGVMTHAKCNFGPLGPTLSFLIGADGWRWGEERRESAEEIEQALLARKDHRRIREREKQREARRAARRTRMEERIRTYIEQNPGEGISTRELRENIEIRCDSIAGVLNGMLEEGRLLRRRKGKQKVLWSLAEDGNQQRTQSGEKSLKTGSRFQTGSQEPERNGNRLVSMNSRTCPVENNGPRARTGGEKREPVLGTGLHPEAEAERNMGSGKDSPKPKGRSP
ncbi:MAG: AAA family ATPase, partial [Acidobacteria bacterium]|nr:AAA family ATPase [Acidobacteriota bacterium]